MDRSGKVIFFFVFPVCTFQEKNPKTVLFHAQFDGSWIRQSLRGVCATRICAELDKFPAGPERELWPREMLSYSFDIQWIKTQIGSCWRMRYCG